MHRPIFEDRMELTPSGKLVRVVNARWKKMDLDVYRQYEDGRVKVRNLFFAPVSGYMVEFKDWGLQRWGTARLYIWGLCDYTPDERDRLAIEKAHPNFKYILQKCPNLTMRQIMQVLPIWKKCPQVELLLAAGFYDIAVSKQFHTMPKPQQKKLVSFLATVQNQGNFKIKEVMDMMKYGLTAEQKRSWSWFNIRNHTRFGWEEYMFLQEKDSDYIRLYADYRKMAKKAGHDFTEKYWQQPKNLREMHSRVMKEVELIEAAQEKAKLEKKQKMYLQAVKKILKKQVQQDGWKVYVPESVEDISEQAKKLNQCLIRCDYIAKVIRKECTLVFLKYNGKPVATAEIMPDGNLGQFYGNEGAKNIYPSKKARAMLQQWMQAA